VSTVHVRVSLTFLAAALLTDAVLSIPEPLSDLLALACLVPVIFAVAVPLRSGRDGWRAGVPAAVVFVIAALALGVFAGPAEVLVVVVVIWGLGRLANPREPADRQALATQVALLTYAVYLLLLAYVPMVDRAQAGVASVVSSLASAVAPGDVSLGVSMLGLRMFALVGCGVVGALAVMPGRDTYITAAKVFAACIAGVVLYGCLWWVIARYVSPGSPFIIEPFTRLYDYRILLLLLIGLVPMMYASGASPRSESDVGKRLVPVAACALVVGAAAIGMVVNAPVTRADQRVLIVDTGDIEHDLPDFDSFGLESAGRFGLLPIYLRARDYDVAVVEELGTDDLEESGTLVLINIRERLDSEVEEAIWKFVENGGSLLVAGDHTGTNVIREPSNRLLERVGISLRFDSAISVREDWVDGVIMRPHPVLYGVEQEELQVLIGASLGVESPASAVLVGRDGFSDVGDIDNVTGGYLGDMRFVPGEQLGDVCLVAQASYGRGKVLVFGDTTTFQNPSIPRSFRFIDNIFGWLSSRGDASLWAGVRIISAFALVVGLVLVLVIAGKSPHVVAVSAVVLGAVLVVSGLVHGAARPTDSYAAPYAVVDVSHFEQAVLQKSPEALDGLVVNLLRNGYTPFLMREFDAGFLGGSNILVTPTPLAPFSSSELDEIERYVEDGGLLIVTSGNERRVGAEDLLERFGMSVGAVPLGQATSTLGPETMHFWSAWPVECDSADVEVVADVWDYPVILYRARGEGGVLAVGDGSFLLNKNLEDVYEYNAHNISFLRALLRALAGSGVPDA